MQPGRCPCCGKKYLLWSPEQMREAARAHYREHGRAPTLAEWKKARPGNPSASSVQYIFGSWGEFVDSCGLPRNERNRTRWTREAIVDSILEFRFTVGRWPTIGDFQSATPAQPCVQTIQRVFGSWTAARKAAGYTGLDRAQHVGGEVRTCRRCGIVANDRTPGCETCRRRHGRRERLHAEKAAAAPLEPRCSGCGTELDNYTSDCTSCTNRKRKAAAREAVHI
jgi:hypothetical protein